MKCNHCGSEWKTNEDISSSLTSCPFCGKSFVKEEEFKFYDNSKDALAAIMNKFGPDILLGKLNNYLSDFAPSIPQNQKKLVYAVYENGASLILKNNLNSSQTDRKNALNSAARKLTDAFIVEDMAENIISEFAAALGWQIGKPECKETLSGVDKGIAWTYAGDILNGLRHGNGKCTWSDGDVYEGDFADDKPSGSGKYTYADGDVYEGDFVHGKPNGRGKNIYADGSVYEGDYIDGKRSGRGKYTFADGDVYEGDFVDDKRSGKGKYTYTDGDVYEGDFVHGYPGGKGKYTYANGDVYEGDYINGKPSGKGKYTRRCKL